MDVVALVPTPVPAPPGPDYPRIVSVLTGLVIGLSIGLSIVMMLIGIAIGRCCCKNDTLNDGKQQLREGLL